jgi:uncharacterized damage-inducible protein DinB
MLAHIFRSLYAYNRWATAKVLDEAAKLTAEQLHRPGQAGHGSIRDTLLHLLRTQLSWLSWWDGSLPPLEAYLLQLEPADHPGIPELRARWEQIEAQTARFVNTLTEGDLARIYTFQIPNGPEQRLPLWQMMLQVANHATQHRSEVAAMLTELGHSPGNLDFLFFLFLQSDGTTP